MRIVIVDGHDGQRLALQLVRKLYAISDEDGKGRPIQMMPPPAKELYVSHFDTCPKASSFSRRKGARKGGR